jgi:SAM-dependent methyltransferase
MDSYRKLCTEFYALSKPSPPERELAFYRQLAAEAAGPVLEPMCGTGRFLIPLREAGFDVDGIDASADMLRMCRERKTPVNVYEQFLHELQLPRRYGLVFIPAGSFNLVSDLDEARESLRRIHEHMLPGARLVAAILSDMPAEYEESVWSGRWVSRPDGAKIVLSWLGQSRGPDGLSHSLGRYELIQDGKLLETEFEEMVLRFHSEREFRELLTQVGFTNIEARRVQDCYQDEADDTLTIYLCTKSR